MSHAARAAEAIGGAAAAPWDDMDEALGASDIVITATGAASPILTKARVEAVMRGRRTGRSSSSTSRCRATSKPPPANSSRCSSTTSTTCRRPCGRTSRAARARSSAPRRSSARSSSGSWRGCARAAPMPTVVALRQHFEAIRRSELARLESKLSGLPPEAPRARRRGHAAHRREAAARADRTAEGACRDAETHRRLHRSANRLFGLGERADDEEPAGGTQRRRRSRAPSTGADRGSAPLRLGTRGSQLALWQARDTAARIAAAGGPRLRDSSSSRPRATADTDRALAEIGGKRLFVKEIEDALLAAPDRPRRAQRKDMPAVLPDGLAIGATLPREDPLDAIVLPAAAPELRRGAGASTR